MTHFNFTTNIEHRMPDTGKVFCIDRMTSDYAEQHPLDVDAFIESVYHEFAGTEFEESRETLRSIWTSVLSVTSPCGDAALYPNKNGAKLAAAMKVWHKAGDYWRRGFRHGDTLPDMVPMCKITRLDGGWIALFPKDSHLLSEQNDSRPVEMPPRRNVETSESRNVETSPCRNVETTPPKPGPLQLDLFTQLQQENEALQARIDELERQEQQRRDKERAERLAREDEKRRHEQQARQHRPDPVRRHQAQPSTAAVSVGYTADNNHVCLKTAGYIVAATVAIVVIWQTGLIIPLGLIGLATSGLLK